MLAHSLSSLSAPDNGTLWAVLCQLVDRVGAALERDAPVEDCLDVLIELLDADRGIVALEEAHGAMRVVHARGPKKGLAPAEHEEMSRTMIRRALDENRAIIWERERHPIDASSIVALDIHAAMVAPLRGRGVPRGVLYVDFRHPLKHVDPAHQEFFMAAVILIGAMFGESGASRDAREKLRAAREHTTERRHGPSLEELLRPNSMASVRAELTLALAGTTPVLIEGESGCGKTLLAQALAEAAGRRPIVRVVLGGSDDMNTIASELFGHEKGAFSGATAKRVGLVEYARGGTLVLDEVLNLPLQAQRMLLDFTQFGTYRPLGYDKPEPKRADVRLIAATNGDLGAAVVEGRFREDLYFRLAGIRVRLPPLRERREDIPGLAESAVRRLEAGVNWTLDAGARRWLLRTDHPWRGNVRELEWVVRRARDRARARHATTNVITADDISVMDSGTRPPPAPSASPPAVDTPASDGEDPCAAWARLQQARVAIETEETELLRSALERHQGVVAHAARELGIARTTLAGRAQALRLTTRK